MTDTLTPEPMKCMDCKMDLAPDNDGMAINGGEYFLCNDCHLMAYNMNIMPKLLIYANKTEDNG